MSFVQLQPGLDYRDCPTYEEVLTFKIRIEEKRCQKNRKEADRFQMTRLDVLLESRSA